MAKSITFPPKPFHFIFEKELTLAKAEWVAIRMGGEELPSRDVIFDIRNCRSVDIGAGWLISNSSRRYQHHSDIKVMLTTEQLEMGNSPFAWLTKTGLGFGFSKYANKILADDIDVTDRFHDYYHKGNLSLHGELDGHLWGDLTKNQEYVCINDIHTNSVLDPYDDLRFAELFGAMASYVQVKLDLYSDLTSNSLCTAVQEATQNVYDHSTKKPLSSVEIQSFLAMSYCDKLKLSKSVTNELKNYLKSFKALNSVGFKYKGFVEIIVTDDGNGIAARQSLNQHIYWDDPERERIYLEKALEDGGSVKPMALDCRSQDLPGFGFKYIVQSLKRAKGLAVLRTGRFLLSYDSTTEQEGFVLKESAGYLPGAVLQIILPVRR